MILICLLRAPIPSAVGQRNHLLKGVVLVGAEISECRPSLSRAGSLDVTPLRKGVFVGGLRWLCRHQNPAFA